jgi:TPR repeat protein
MTRLSTGAEKFFWLPLRDYPQALAWYRRSGDLGNSNAENQLGYITEEG